MELDTIQESTALAKLQVNDLDSKVMGNVGVVDLWVTYVLNVLQTLLSHSRWQVSELKILSKTVWEMDQPGSEITTSVPGRLRNCDSYKLEELKQPSLVSMSSSESTVS